MGQTARVLLKEAVQEGGPAGEDSDDDAANPLWGQREDKQIQVGAGCCCVHGVAAVSGLGGCGRDACRAEELICVGTEHQGV